MESSPMKTLFFLLPAFLTWFAFNPTGASKFYTQDVEDMNIWTGADLEEDISILPTLWAL